MSTVQKEVAKLFRWYQSPTDNTSEEIQLSEDFLCYHRLDAIYLSYCLDRGMPEHIPPALLAKRDNIISKYSFYRKIASSLSARLREENINHACLKGIVLADGLYSEPWHRYFSDLDLLVDKEKLSAVESILIDMGYLYGYFSERNGVPRYPTRAEIIFQRTYTHELYKMFKMENASFATHIDVNFLFMWRGTHKQKNILSVSDLCNHVVRVGDIQVFDNITNMLHLCCHLYNEAVFFALNRNYKGGDPREILLIRVFDIALLAKRLTKEEYTELLTLAKKMDCIDKVAYSFGLTNLLLELDIGHGIDALNLKPTESFSEYYGKDQQCHTWPISIYDRVFNLQKKREVSDILFPAHRL